MPEKQPVRYCFLKLAILPTPAKSEIRASVEPSCRVFVIMPTSETRKRAASRISVLCTVKTSWAPRGLYRLSLNRRTSLDQQKRMQRPVQLIDRHHAAGFKHRQKNPKSPATICVPLDSSVMKSNSTSRPSAS